MIRPYRAKSSISESHVELAKETVVSQTEPRAQVPNAECPQLAPLVFEDRGQPVDIALPTSPYTEISRPEVDPNSLPVCNLLAATAPPECQQQDPSSKSPMSQPHHHQQSLRSPRRQSRSSSAKPLASLYPFPTSVYPKATMTKPSPWKQ